MKQQLTIGLFGFGVVGQGLYDIIGSNTGLPIHIKKICCKHPEKRRTLPMDNFTFDRNDLLKDAEINLIVEAIDDPQASFEICKYALENGVNVVTSNKKMVAEHQEELLQLQKENKTSLLYEASSCGSIPIIRTLEEYYDNDFMNSVSGILNGSTNFVLSKIFNENRDYDLALKQAQELGFVENNPTLDIVGYDALYKLIILTTHAYGIFVDPKNVVVHGIQYISRYDIEYAQERGVKVKQIACVRKFEDNKIGIYVIPHFVKPDSPLYNVEYEDNAVLVDAAFCGEQYYRGKGAGGHPTGFAMFSDISALMYGYQYEYKKHLNSGQFTHSNDLEIEVYFRYFEEKNLKHFDFEVITAQYKSKAYNYVIGTIKLNSLMDKIDVLNRADIFVVATGN